MIVTVSFKLHCEIDNIKENLVIEKRVKIMILQAAEKYMWLRTKVRFTLARFPESAHVVTAPHL